MLFNSYIFLFMFLPLTWIAFRIACSKHVTDVAVAVLLVASLFFYSYWNPPFVFLILFSVLFNYSWGRFIQNGRAVGGDKGVLLSKFWLYSGVIVNLAFIGYFKYSNFFMSNIAFLTGFQWTTKEVFLPLGISFFTFQQMAYLFDSYKGLIKKHGFTQYALFVTFFPQLIAGPIVRFDQIIPQISNLRTYVINYHNVAIGLSLLSLGLFKKVVIADTLSPWVAAVFDSTNPLTFFESWAGILCYTFQIYFDFSGYSDMAVGLGKLFNIDIPINFNSPYKATSIIDFWKRWHISLSIFLRDYLYIPLGGNKKGSFRRYVNLMITMLLGGLWHGASWNFVLWGGLHGCYLCINHEWIHLSKSYGVSTPKKFGWLVTFIAIVFAWVFFRSPSFVRTGEIISGMIGLNGVIIPPNYLPIPAFRDIVAMFGVEFQTPVTWTILGGRRQLLLMVLCFLSVILLPNSLEWTQKQFHKPKLSLALVVAGSFVLSVIFMDRISEFLYFQF